MTSTASLFNNNQCKILKTIDPVTTTIYQLADVEHVSDDDKDDSDHDDREDSHVDVDSNTCPPTSGNWPTNNECNFLKKWCGGYKFTILHKSTKWRNMGKWIHRKNVFESKNGSV